MAKKIETQIVAERIPRGFQTKFNAEWTLSGYPEAWLRRVSLNILACTLKAGGYAIVRADVESEF